MGNYFCCKAYELNSASNLAKGVLNPHADMNRVLNAAKDLSAEFLDVRLLDEPVNNVALTFSGEHVMRTIHFPSIKLALHLQPNCRIHIPFLALCTFSLTAHCTFRQNTDTETAKLADTPTSGESVAETVTGYRPKSSHSVTLSACAQATGNCMRAVERSMEKPQHPRLRCRTPSGREVC